MAAISKALRRAWVSFGIATAAMISMIAITINSSIIVKPLRLRGFMYNLPSLRAGHSPGIGTVQPPII